MILILSISTPYLSFQTLSPQAWLHHRQSTGGRSYHINVSILRKIMISTIVTIIVTRTVTLTLGSSQRIATTTPLEPLFIQGMSASLASSEAQHQHQRQPQHFHQLHQHHILTVTLLPRHSSLSFTLASSPGWSCWSIRGTT